MRTVKGSVLEVAFAPGGKRLLRMEVVTKKKATEQVTLCTDTAQSQLMVQGEEVNGAGLIHWLLTHEADVVALVDPSRYEACTKAEFTEHCSPEPA